MIDAIIDIYFPSFSPFRRCHTHILHDDRFIAISIRRDIILPSWHITMTLIRADIYYATPSLLAMLTYITIIIDAIYGVIIYYFRLFRYFRFWLISHIASWLILLIAIIDTLPMTWHYYEIIDDYIYITIWEYLLRHEMLLITLTLMLRQYHYTSCHISLRQLVIRAEYNGYYICTINIIEYFAFRCYWRI